MKLTVDIPEWAIGGHIYVIAKGQLLAYQSFQRDKIRTEEGEVIVKEYYKPLKVKPDNALCDGCKGEGLCCQVSAFAKDLQKEMKDRLNNPPPNEACPMYSPDRGCIMGYRSMIPLSCLISDCSAIVECNEQFVEVD